MERRGEEVGWTCQQNISDRWSEQWIAQAGIVVVKNATESVLEKWDGT
jgi:hypothetical protein